MVDFLSPERCRGRRSAKWTLYEPDVLPLPVAEMDVVSAPAVRDVLRTAVDRSDTGYPPMDGGPARAFAEFALRRWGWRIEPDDPQAAGRVVMASDVGAAIVNVLRYLAGEGAVVVSPPVYPQFLDWPGLAGRPIRTVPLLRQEPAGTAPSESPPSGSTYRLDLEGLERAFAAGVSAYVLCHPHNPVGRVHTRAELIELARLARRYDVLVVSDEVHAPLVFEGVEFVPFLHSCPEAAEVGVAVHAASKAWNIAGLKCAFVVLENERLRRRFASVSGELPWQAGIFGALAAEAAYLRGIEWLDELVAELPGLHAHLGSRLAELLPAARMSPADFGFLAWVDLSPLGWATASGERASAGEDEAAAALRLGRVALGVGPAFGEGGEGFVRVNVGTHRHTIDEAVRRLAATDRALAGG